MDAMSSAWLGIATTVMAAVLAFLFGRINLTRATRSQREEDVRRQRLETYATFCSNVIDFRRAQLHRWHVGRRLGGPVAVEENLPDVANDVRKSRAAAWAAYYRVLMICNDTEIEQRARKALDATRDMKDAPTEEELDRRSDLVRNAVDDFARCAAGSVLSTKPLELAPPARSAR
jgi:hypothetical protein